MVGFYVMVMDITARKWAEMQQAESEQRLRTITDNLPVLISFTDANGIVRFRNATPLRRGVAEITEERLRDPLIAFFARANPGHANGDELACITEVPPANLTPAGTRRPW